VFAPQQDCPASERESPIISVAAIYAGLTASACWTASKDRREDHPEAFRCGWVDATAIAEMIRQWPTLFVLDVRRQVGGCSWSDGHE